MEKKSSQQQYILKRLKIQNMFSIENVELNFDKNNNFILIDGENRDNGNNNGSGKSSIIKSILF
jgi:predicted ATP-binding protein involved in virulence